MQIVKNTYFKRGKGISGISLPATVTGVHFVRCDFHPNCWNLKFVDCVFEDCGIKGCLTRTTNCLYIDDEGGVGYI